MRGPGRGNLIYGGPFGVLNGVGDRTGAGAGDEKKKAPPRAVERGGAGNLAGGPEFSGPRRPRNEHYVQSVRLLLKTGRTTIP